MKFISQLAVAVAFSFAVIASPTPAPAVSIITENEFRAWLSNTDANITWIGPPLEPINSLAPRQALNTIVTYCTIRAQNVCGGSCLVYNGGSTCLSTPGTNCLAATSGNVAFCDRDGCGGSCNQLSSCGTQLDDGFCATPGTSSILVGA